MDFVVAQLALIFLPGLIWSNLDSKFVVGVRSTHFQAFLKPFSFGLFTYGVLFVIYGLVGRPFSIGSVADAPNQIDLVAFADEIIFSVPLAFVLAILWMYFQNYRILMRVLHALKATRRYGDQDIWTFTLNSSQPHVEYVNLRNTDTGYTYSGWVNAFSEREEFREILLEDALIIDPDGQQTRMPHLYISMAKTNIWMEFPYTENERFYEHGADTAETS